MAMTAPDLPIASPASAQGRTTVPARFLGWGVAIPEGRLTNADLEQRMETSDSWIVDRTGISERRIAAPGQTTADLAIEAGRKAIERSGVPAGDIDLLIVATTTPDTACPATAARVQHALGTAGAAFDLNAACAGFVHALHVGAATLRSAGLRHVLVIGAERLTAFVEPTDRGTAILFGDGAGALVIGAHEADRLADPEVAAGLPGILSVDLGGDGSGAPFLEVPQGERWLRMDGQEVFRRATRGMVGSCSAALERAGVDPHELALFVPHQANVRIIDATAGRLGLEPAQVMVNIDRYGNTSAASVPIALAEAADAGRLNDGDLVLTCGIGAGMAWATLVMRWGA